MRLMQQIWRMRREHPLPKIKGLRSLSFSLRPFRWRMTFYLFLLRPQRLPQTMRLCIHLGSGLSAEQWHVSYERPTQAELLGIKYPRPVIPRVWRPRAARVPVEPEIEIIPLAPVWR